MTVEPQVVISDATERNRFIATLDGEQAGFIVYRLRPGLLALIHTEVDEALEGRGLGSRLIATALDDARREGLEVVLLCLFVVSYIRRHPEYQDIVAADYHNH